MLTLVFCAIFLIERCFLRIMGRSLDRLVKLVMMSKSFKWLSRLRAYVKTREQSWGPSNSCWMWWLLCHVWLSPLAGVCGALLSIETWMFVVTDVVCVKPVLLGSSRFGVHYVLSPFCHCAGRLGANQNYGISAHTWEAFSLCCRPDVFCSAQGFSEPRPVRENMWSWATLKALCCPALPEPMWDSKTCLPQLCSRFFYC